MARRWRKRHPQSVERHTLEQRAQYRPAARHEAVCEGCGGEFMALDGQRYCARWCKPSTGAKVTATCDGCGREFEARARDRAKGLARFCGKSCAAIARGLGRTTVAA